MESTHIPYDHLNFGKRVGLVGSLAAGNRAARVDFFGASANHALAKRLIRCRRGILKRTGLPVVTGTCFRQPSGQRHH